MRLLDRDVFFFTTFGGEALSLAAAKATIHEMKTKPVQAYLAAQGKKLREGYTQIARDLGVDRFTSCIGFDCRTMVTFAGDGMAVSPLEMKSLVQQEMIKRGVLWGGFHNVCFAHTDADVAHTLAAYRDALGLLQRAIAAGNVRAMLRGDPLEPVFRKTSHFHTKPVTKG